MPSLKMMVMIPSLSLKKPFLMKKRVMRMRVMKKRKGPMGMIVMVMEKKQATPKTQMGALYQSLPLMRMS